MDFIIIIVLCLVFVYGPLLGVKLAGYLIQKYKFGNSFKEVRAYHKAQDALEANQKGR